MENIIDTVVPKEASRKNVRMIIPILIRWAKLGIKDKTYGDLIKAINKTTFSGIGQQLAYVQMVMIKLSEIEGREIPTLNSLVKNKNTHLPSEGFEFVTKKYNKLDEAGKKKFIEGLDSEAINFKYWNWVLDKLGLTDTVLYTEEDVKTYTGSYSYGGGEGKEHKSIKEYIYNHPERIGIDNVVRKEMEYILPSGDRLDVYFETETEQHIAIEVKPSTSPEHDTFRGIFQCVKYQAVMDALRSAESGGYENKTLLVCAGSLSAKQVQLSDELKVKVITDFKCN